MDLVKCKSCYKGIILQRNFLENDQFPYNSFVKLHGKKICDRVISKSVL